MASENEPGPRAHGSTGLLVLAFAVAFSVMLLVPLWAALDAIDTSAAHEHGGGLATTPAAFQELVDAQAAAFGRPDGAVQVPPGSPVYVLLRQFSFTPATIHLQRGAEYDLVLYAADVTHGVSLIMDGSLSTVLVPGSPVTLRVRPTQVGVVEIRCTEYCGVGHHIMTASFIVAD